MAAFASAPSTLRPRLPTTPARSRRLWKESPRSDDGTRRKLGRAPLIYQDQQHVVPLAEVEARMRPGNYSQSGFLGPNESLLEVLGSDARQLGELGVEASVLAAGLGQLL